MDPREYDWQMGDLADQSNYPPGVDPSAIGTAVKNWWTSQPSWLSRAQAENQKTTEAFQRGGMGAVAQQLATDTTEAQDLASGFGGNIKGVKPPVVPGALAAISEYRPPFYSAVEQAVQGAKQNAAPGQQWAGFLRNQPGVKPEEVEALGLGKLFEQPGSVPKEAVLGEIAANRVNVGEVIKGTPHNYPHQTADEWAAAINSAEKRGNWAEAHRLTQAQEGINPATGSTAGSTKFQQYTLPGGENYREMLLTLPHKDKGVYNSPRYAELSGKSSQGTLTTAENAELNNMIRQAEGADAFKSSHYDEPNILAHVRYNDRVIDGKKTLFVEEVQSDWHQKGKRQGYTSEQPLQWSEPRVITSDGTKMWSATDRNGYEYKVRQDPDGKFYGIAQNVNATPQGASTLNEAQTAAERYISQRGGGTVPDAPFKTTWPELAMKRIIREAAEKGYDKVAWTPGSVQAERYDLSKHVKDLHVQTVDEGKFIIEATDHNGRPVEIGHTEPIPRDKLADYVGKDLANNILKDASAAKVSSFGKLDRTYSGVDLKVGGEGMKGFYDEILPATVNKLVKKYGGRVSMSDPAKASSAPMNDIAHELGYGGWHTGLTKEQKAHIESVWKENQSTPRAAVHMIDITPSLRAQAMKGFPLFTAGGVAATGVISDLARQDEYRQ